MIPLFPHKHITPETCSYSHAAIYSNSSVTGGKKERIKFAFVEYFCSDLIWWTWKQFCNLCTGTLHLLEFAWYLFRDEAHPIIQRRLRWWWWWGSCLWRLVERLWRSFEKEWSLPFVSCARVLMARGQCSNGSFFSFSCLPFPAILVGQDALARRSMVTCPCAPAGLSGK